MQCIYLIRHGQSMGQAQNTVHGELTPLSGTGRMQIESLVPFMSQLNIDALYTSPLKRAQESAEILATALGIPYQLENDFGEWNYHGGFTGTWDEYRAQYPELFIDSGVFDPDFKMGDGESYKEFVARVQGRSLQLKEDVSENIAIVSHFCALNIITNALLGVPMREEFYFEFANGSITKISSRVDLPLRLTFGNRTFY